MQSNKNTKMVNRTVVEGNQIPMLRHTPKKRKKKKKLIN